MILKKLLAKQNNLFKNIKNIKNIKKTSSKKARNPSSSSDSVITRRGRVLDVLEAISQMFTETSLEIRL